MKQHFVVLDAKNSVLALIQGLIGMLLSFNLSNKRIFLFIIFAYYHLIYSFFFPFLFPLLCNFCL